MLAPAQLAALLLIELAKPSLSGWLDWHTPVSTGLCDRVAADLGVPFTALAQHGLATMDRLEEAGLVERRAQFASYRITGAGRAVAA